MNNFSNISKKNILMISDDFLPAATGVGIHLQIICKQLALEGHNVIIFTSKQNQQKDYEEWEGVKVHRFFSLKIAGFYQAMPNIMKARKIISQNKIEIVHFHYISFLMVAIYLLTRKINVKKIYTFHMTEQHLTQPWFMRPFRSTIRNLITRFSNLVDCVISPSENLKLEIKNQGVIKPIYYISNPISDNYFQKKTIIDNINNKPGFKVLYVGRLNLEKNVSLLLEAFKIHLESFPKSQLEIIGKGDQEAKLKKLAIDLKIQDHVSFLGFMNQKQLAQYYSSCQVFVLPSIVETQGMVAMEAMSFSKPVIVTKEIISANELVTDGLNGYIVDAFHADELALRLNELASSSDLCQQLGRAGFLKIYNFSPIQVVEKLTSIYTDKIKTNGYHSKESELMSDK